MNEKQMNILLQKKYWHLEDICIFFGCGRNKASQIRQKAIKDFNGFEPIFPQRVKRDSVLKAMNIDI
ncbi:MAG: hypothetical protein IKP50_03955 [Bacilli bacterium]|nr:hypothetical protein [Bacilli bacterium]